MASLSTSTSSLHRDVRSDSIGYKRDKDHSAKWAFGSRPLYGKKRTWWPELDAPTDPDTKVRPDKYHNRRCSFCYGFNHTNPRKTEAIREITYTGDGHGLSKSVSDLLPAGSPGSPDDGSIMYSFDAPCAPCKTVGLDSLVDKAEMEWKSRETDKIVRDEYAVLDKKGEIRVMTTKGKGKKGGNSPRARAQSVTSYDEDDWERI